MKTERTLYQSMMRVLLVTALLLSVPLAAKLLTAEMGWSLFDFVLMGALIAGTGLAYELSTRNSSSISYRAAVGIALLGAFLLVWLNLAVGLIGSEDNPANALYIGVLVIAFAGALIARFRPGSMARAMLAAALGVAVIAAVAVAFRLGGAASGPAEILGVNAVFVALFAGSAALFRQAARAETTRRMA
jgi:hypothetical protein